MLTATGVKTLIKFGEHVKAIRLSKGFTLRELGDKGELRHNAISTIESGKQNITLTTLLKLAHLLDVPPKKLLDIEGL